MEGRWGDPSSRKMDASQEQVISRLEHWTLETQKYRIQLVTPCQLVAEDRPESLALKAELPTHLCWPSEIEWETQRAGAWLNVSNQRTFLCIIIENMQWIYQPFSPIYQQQAAVVWRKSIHPSKAAFCFGSILILKCFKTCDLFFSLGGRTAHTNYPVSLLYISNKRACPENMVTSRHTWTRIYGL